MKIKRTRDNLFFGTDFGLPLRLLPDWAFNKGKGWSCDLAFPTVEMKKQIADITARYLAKKQAKKTVKKRLEKGRSSPDYNPAKVDFNPEIKPLLPPKMAREEISEMVKLVDAKSKTKTGASKKAKVLAAKAKRKA